MWSLFKKLRIEVISEEGQSSEMGLLAWIRKMTEGYDGVEIKNFKDSFNDGLAFSALINAMDNEALDYNNVDRKNPENALLNAFDIAEKKLGIPKLLDTEDLLSGNVDERAVILYSSMFFHAFIADEEKRKLMEQKKSIGEQIAELKARLAKEQAEKEHLLSLQQQQNKVYQREQDDKEALIAKLRERIRQLLEEIAFLRQRVSSDAELRGMLESKLKMLQDLLNESAGAEGDHAPISKEDLLAWVKKKTEKYPGVKVENFTDSFKDGVVLSALINAVDPTALDFNKIDRSNPEATLLKAVSLAESKLGIAPTVDVNALSKGKADENNVADYTAQFLRKYINEDKAKAKGGSAASRKFTKEDLLEWAQKMTEGYDNVNIENFTDSFKDGLALSALINAMDPEALNFKSLNPNDKEGNVSNALNVAEKRLGVAKTINAKELLSGTASEPDVVNYVGKYFQKYIGESDLFGNPAFGKVGKTPSPLAGAFPPKSGFSGAKFSKEDLLNWVKATTDGYPNVNVKNFKESFNDGLAFSALIHSMDPTALEFNLIDPTNVKENITRALNIAEKKFGIPKLLNVDDLLNGKAKEDDIVAYNAQFFQKYLDESGLFASGRSQGLHAEKSPETDLLNWTKKVTEGYPNVDIVTFKDSFNDGLAFAAIVNSIDPDAIDFKSLDPKNVRENVVKAFDAAEKKLGIPNTINPDDLINGKVDERDIIEYNSKFFNKFLEEIGVNKDDSKYNKADLLKWVKKMTDGYDNVDVKDYQHSFSDGLALSALIHSMDPSAIDFESLDPKNKKGNLANAITVAEKKFGIPKFENVDALLNGKASEAEVAAYTAKFLDKYIDEAGKYGIAGSKIRNKDPYAPEADLLKWAKKATEGYDGVDISSFKTSFNDGLAFSALIDNLAPGAINFSALTPDDKQANLLNAFAIAESALGIPKSLNAEELINGTADERDVMAYTSNFFQKYLDKENTSKAPFTEADLLNWAKELTSHYDNVDVKDFKTSFNDGLALAALVHAIDPSAIDFHALDSKDAKGNLVAAVQAAEKKFGVPGKSLDTNALAAGKADEKQVSDYVGKLFHKYIKEAGKYSKFGENSLDKQAAGTVTDESDRDKLLRELEERKNQLLAELNALQSGIQKEIQQNKKLKDEINFLKEQAAANEELRLLLDQKVNVLESLITDKSSQLNDLSEQQHKLAAELDKSKRVKEALESGANNLETERNLLLSTAEEKDKRLKELEERRKRLLDEIAELQRKVKEALDHRQQQAAEIASLKKQIEAINSKQIVHTKARVGLDALKKNLEEHLEDLYRWRDLYEIEGKEGVEEFDLTKVIADISNKSFEEQLTYLDGKLQEENKNLTRIIKLKDSKDYLDDVVVKAGWLVMKGHKEWKKRWFKLAGDRLVFYEDDTTTDVAGFIPLDQGCDVVRHKALKDEEGSNKKVWPLKVSVGDKKLFVRAATKKERHSWFAALSSKIAHLNYSKYCSETGERPDTRLVGALNATTVPHLYLANRPLSNGMVQALVKGLPGRDELESFAVEASALTDDLFLPLCDVLDKLTGVKSFSFRGNQLTSGIAQRFASVVRPPTVTDINVADNKFTDEFLEALAPAVAQSSNLSSLVLTGNQFSAAGAKALATAWTADGASVVVADLLLGNNRLGDEGLKNLLPLFSKYSFNKVELSGNGIGDDSVVALAEALQRRQVSVLDLSNNKISAKGALALKNLMENNTNLHTVLLSNNNLASTAESANLFSASGFKFSELSLSRA